MSDDSQDTSSGKIAPPSRVGERVRSPHKSPASIHKIIREIKRPLVSIFFAPLDIIFNKSKQLKQIQNDFPKVMSLNETIDLLIAGASICRFGDGEFREMRLHLNAQEPSPKKKMAQRLAKVLAVNSTDRCVIAVPPYRLEHERKTFRYGWLDVWQFMWLENWEFIGKRLTGRTFGNAYVSRNAGFHEISLEKYRKIWAGKDVVFITGKNGRFFDEPRLFDCIHSAEYLFVDPLNAYEQYDEILQQALTFNKSTLFIICAGFLATFLAYELHNSGYQALDLGHLPNCYRQYLKEAPRPEKIAAVRIR